MSETITASEIIRRQNSPEQKERDRKLSELISKAHAENVAIFILDRLKEIYGE